MIRILGANRLSDLAKPEQKPSADAQSAKGNAERAFGDTEERKTVIHKIQAFKKERGAPYFKAASSLFSVIPEEAVCYS